MLRRTIEIVGLTIGIIGLSPWFAATAHAHFIWADFVETAGQPPQVRLCFGESAAPGEAHLIGKIAKSKAWALAADGTTTPVALETKIDESTGSLVGKSPVASPLGCAVVCDYGVSSRTPGGTRLHYYAKHLADNWPSQKPEALRADGLKHDILPSLRSGKLDLLVLFEGSPDAGREVVIQDPNGDEHTLQTDDHGKVSIDAALGRYAIRAGHINARQGGTIDGKDFARTASYSTLTLNVPTTTGVAGSGGESAKNGNPSGDGAKGAEPTAKELLRQARLARAVWENFPGYTADVTVSMAKEDVSGKVTVDGNGIVTMEMAEGPARNWVETQVASLAQHRMPDGEVDTGEVTYADADTRHPLGRRIDLGDPRLGSVYRIRDNVIYEVNRNAGPMRFTITVLDVTWNSDHKYLPRTFTMSFFDAKTGELKQSTAHVNEWQRVGAFDVPKLILEIGAGEKSSGARQMTFKNYRLTEKR